MSLRFNLLLSLISLSASASEKKVIVVLNDGTQVSGVKVISKKQSDNELNLAGIVVGESKLSDVRKKFPSGNIFHDGDAGNSVYVLCYQGKDGTIAAFESSGEMGGADHIVTFASVMGKDTSYRFKQHCLMSDSINREIKSFTGLHLGMTKADVKKIMGTPSKEISTLILYNYEVNEAKTSGTAEINSNLDVRFTGDNASQFSFSKIESF
jgi:hypothetical protein